MLIRPATAADAPGIAAIWNPVIRDTLVTFNPVEKTEGEIAQTIAARIALNQPFLVAVDGAGQVAGFATYFQFRAGLGYARAMEHTILLAPWAWGKGVGRRLMTVLEDHGRKAGISCLIGGVSGSNPAGIAFHAAIGFVETGRLPRTGYKFGRFHDLVLMQKLL